jgi:hypothetical protein
MSISTAQCTQAVRALKESPIPALRRLRVESNGEVLVLSGRVPSYYYKQMAQETVLPHLAGQELVNRIVVVRREASSP